MLPVAIWQFFKKGQDFNEVKTLSWRDQTLRFDLKPSSLALGKGEVLIGSSYHTEDIKGNLGQSGTLQVTNMRAIWVYDAKPKINISIGYGTILNAFQRTMKTSLGDNYKSVCVLAMYASVKYEFIFKKLDLPPLSIDNDQSKLNGSATFVSRADSISNNDNNYTSEAAMHRYSLDPCETIIKVWNAYKATVSFRRCRINLSTLYNINGEINLLASEEIFDRYASIYYKTKNVWSEGVLILTNIRIIWVSNKDYHENISIPYTQVESTTADNSKENSSFKIHLKVVYYSNLMFDSFNICSIVFRLGTYSRKSAHENVTQLQIYRTLYKQISILVNTYTESPRFGPEVCDECKLLMQQFTMMKSNTNSNDTSLFVYDNSVVSANLVDCGQDESNDDSFEYLNTGKTRYTTGEPSLNSNHMFYHNGTCLAFEGKAEDTDIETIWRIDV